MCDPSENFQKRERGPANYGPARQVFANPFAILIPARESVSESEYDFYLRIALYISYSHYFAVGTRAPILTDRDLLSEPSKIKAHNFVLLGGLANSVFDSEPFREARARLPLKFDEDGSFTLETRCHFGLDQNFGVVTTLSTWDESTSQPRMHLVIHGTTFAGITDVVKISFASNQALTRAAYTNMVPDFLVTGPEFRWKGYGGLYAIGFWGNEWDLRDEISYVSCAS